MEKQEREKRKEEERMMREKQRQQERFQREERRENERREKFLQKESLKVHLRNKCCKLFVLVITFLLQTNSGYENSLSCLSSIFCLSRLRGGSKKKSFAERRKKQD